MVIELFLAVHDPAGTNWFWSQSYKNIYANAKIFGVGVITKKVYFDPIKLLLYLKLQQKDVFLA
jgi:hypothetical protein